MAAGHAGHEELLAMVESKLHEPTSSGFDDPTEWSEDDLREFLDNVGTPGLIASIHDH